MDIFASILIALSISIGINFCFFLFGYWLKNDLFTDITYASTFLITTIVVMLINHSYGLSQYIILILVFLWSARLGSYLFIRIMKTKVDHRFDKMRNSFWKFGAFWLLQAITVWLVNMPSYVVMLSSTEEFSTYSLIPAIFALFFLSIETIADLQKYRFMNRKQKTFINEGLWKISRHPNYFGEVSFWWMLMVISLVNDFETWKLISLIGPIYITFTIYKLSGVPILEKNGIKKFGNDPQYWKYLNSVSCVIPFIGMKGVKSKWKS